jgi:hypothetical protein
MVTLITAVSALLLIFSAFMVFSAGGGQIGAAVGSMALLLISFALALLVAASTVVVAIKYLSK